MTAEEFPEAEAMLRAAQASTGLDDWGGEALFGAEFVTLFTAMRNSIVTDAQLLPHALAGAELRLRAMAETRLRVIEDRKLDPGIAAEVIRAPIIVLGLPRAGSTFLHTLLAQDPANRAPLSWEMLLPSPPPTGDDPARIALAERLLDGIGELDPRMRDFHHGGPREPEECQMMFEHVALGDILPGHWRLSSYNKVRAGVRDAVPYGTHHMVLQALQHGQPGRRLALKYPGHIFHLDALLAHYPDALLVQTHRDPAKVIASVTATVAMMRRVCSNAPLREESIAKGNLAAYARVLAETMARRAADPALDQQICDVHFRGLIADPIGTVRAVYAHFGLALSSEAEVAMRAWLQNAESHMAKRKFTLAEFGLGEDDVEAGFAGYIEHYGIARERPA